MKVVDYAKANEKVKPLISHILQQCENDGFTYEELSFLCAELRGAVSKIHRDALSQVFVRKHP